MSSNHPEGTVYLLFLTTDNEILVPQNGKRFWEIPVPLPKTSHWLFLTKKPLERPPDFEVCDIVHREVRMVGKGNRVAVFRRWNYAQEEGVQYKPRDVSRKLESLDIEDYRIIMSALDKWMGGNLGEKIAVIDGSFDALSERSEFTVKSTLRGSEEKSSRQRRTRSAVEKPKRKEVLRLAPKSLAVNFHGDMPMASDTLDHFTLGQTLSHSMIGTSEVEEHVMSTTHSTSFDRSWYMHMAPRGQVYEGYSVDEAV